MGNQRHSSPVIRKTRAWLRAGAVGTIREVHCWTRRPTWPQGIVAAPAGQPVPKELDWDLWLGPAPERAYNPAYHPYNWRGWRDFGTGALGAMGCHVLDAPFWILELDKINRFRVEAESEGMSDQAWPTSSHIRYIFPACDDRSELTVHWYDGGRRPAKPEGMPPRRELDANGAIFVGDQGTLTCGDVVNVNDPDDDIPMLLPESRWKSFKPPKNVDRLAGSWEHDFLGNHEHLWLEACKNGEQPSSHFEYSAALTEMVLLGNLALQAGEPIEWDRAKMEVVSPSDANQYVAREYRKGWSI
jgi:predicted dehydrogenase